MAASASSAGRALAVLNARSGSGGAPQLRGQLGQALAAAGIDCDILLAHSGEELLRATAHAVAGGTRLVIAGGGDGTQSAVASVLAGTEAVQGVLPLGTLNHFAKDLGVPLDLEDAVRTVAAGQVLRVDVGEVNGRVFVNNSSLGLYPHIVRERELQQLRLGKGKWAALWSATLRATGRPHGLAVRIAADGEEQLRRTPFVFVGNNRYTMEGFRIGERSGLTGGELTLYMARRRGRLPLLRLAVRALFGALEQDDDFEMATGESFVIDTRDARIRVATDGEVTMLETPLRYRIRPKALRVLVPPDSRGARSASRPAARSRSSSATQPGSAS